MYAEIKTNQVKGIYKVIEITGRIVCVERYDGLPYDVYLNNGEVIRFCDKNGNNLNLKY